MVAERMGLPFQLFRAVLALVLFSTGALSLAHALEELGDHGHLAMVAALQTLGALLLLVPRAALWGGAALLLVLVPGFVFEAAHGDWELHLLVYTAGVGMVMASPRRPVSPLSRS